MILDTGLCTLYRVTSDAPAGDMYNETKEKLFTAWFGDRVVGFSRFFTAKQVNTQVDRLIRILRPSAALKADDVCEIDGALYRIAQAQDIRDTEAGEDVVDLSLERLGEKYESYGGS